MRRGWRFTFLRDSFYADFLPLMAQDGAIRGPAGDGRVAAVAREDVAAVAAVVLADPGRARRRGIRPHRPEALTLAEAAALVKEVTGSPTRYVDETLAEAYASRASYGAPDWQVDAWVSTYTAIAAGEVATVSDAVPRLDRPTGHEPARPAHAPRSEAAHRPGEHHRLAGLVGGVEVDDRLDHPVVVALGVVQGLAHLPEAVVAVRLVRAGRGVRWRR